MIKFVQVLDEVPIVESLSYEWSYVDMRLK